MKHTVTIFEDELRSLSQSIATMGGMAERNLSDSIQALVRSDRKLAQAVIDTDKEIDVQEHLIEESAVLMIAKRQPMARDLREIMAAIRISGDLERIGDLSKNTAKRVIAITPMAMPQSLILGLESMSERALLQLKDVLDAYGRRDTDLAVQVWNRDQEIDAMYTSVFRELLTYMIEDPRLITGCTHLLFGAKNIERIGDHATNIAETIHYFVSGESLGDDRPKGDGSTSGALSAEVTAK